MRGFRSRQACCPSHPPPAAGFGVHSTPPRPHLLPLSRSPISHRPPRLKRPQWPSSSHAAAIGCHSSWLRIRSRRPGGDTGRRHTAAAHRTADRQTPAPKHAAPSWHLLALQRDARLHLATSQSTVPSRAEGHSGPLARSAQAAVCQHGQALSHHRSGLDPGRDPGSHAQANPAKLDQAWADRVPPDRLRRMSADSKRAAAAPTRDSQTNPVLPTQLPTGHFVKGATVAPLTIGLACWTRRWPDLQGATVGLGVEQSDPPQLASRASSRPSARGWQMALLFCKRATVALWDLRANLAVPAPDHDNHRSAIDDDDASLTRFPRPRSSYPGKLVTRLTPAGGHNAEGHSGPFAARQTAVCFRRQPPLPSSEQVHPGEP